MAEPLPNVALEEFRDRARRYLADTEPIAVTHHGRVVGFYVPIPRDQKETDRTLDRLARRLEQIRQETGMSEEEVADLFDPRKPLPESIWR